MTDTTWTIETKTNGALTFDGAIGDSMPTFSVGQEVTIQLLASDITDSSFESLREFARYANEGTLETGIDIRGQPWYYETTNPTSTYESALIRVEPGPDVGNLREWWVVIADAEIETNAVGNSPSIVLECFVIADVSEYTNRTVVETEFGVEL